MLSCFSISGILLCVGAAMFGKVNLKNAFKTWMCGCPQVFCGIGNSGWTLMQTRDEDVDNHICVRPRDCEDVQSLGHNTTGVYKICPEGTKGFHVRCDMNTEDGAWTVIQRRVSASDFYKSWNEYQTGFGDLEENFWLGNQQIHMLTKQGWYMLRVDLQTPDHETAYATYQVFHVGDAKSNYELLVDGYSGTAGDSLRAHSGFKFSTKDRDNDIHTDNCAVRFFGGWWYSNCLSSNLNGMYGSTDYAKGPVWQSWKGYYAPMKTTEMKIRHWQS